MVWAHHMFTVGLGPIANAIFAVATMAIAVPTGIKIFNWLFTMWGGSIKIYNPNALCSCIHSIIRNGWSNRYHASSCTSRLSVSMIRYFVVAHFHYVIVGGVVLALLAGTHFYWPKMFGTMLNEYLGKITFWLFLIGFHLTFFIQHFLRINGNATSCIEILTRSRIGNWQT